ncbi:hypothetical protein L6164_003360 [Bauhinia variegata]|uniref:Uncharacterized protein n=1 Tax=Bauhinia variegata TaxID=167791 RepID=A0ACB9Q0I4_BAUVA|nr:hypothetical protein L6164_003360 [Bauhinia variegata]
MEESLLLHAMKMEENNGGISNNKVIVLKALMHCEACSNKVSKCLIGLEGVDTVEVDRANNRVVVKGKMANPAKVLERLKNKYSKNVELISPRLMPVKQQEKKLEKKVKAQLKTMVFKMLIHCEGCSNDIKKNILKMEGVVTVEVNREKSLVIVRGTPEPQKIIEHVKKQLGKHAEIIKQENMWNKNENENTIRYCYPPQYSTPFVFPDHIFSDENVFACSIM